EMALGLGPAKGKDTATTLGPMLVTPDELERTRVRGHPDVEMTVSVNGRRYGSDRATHMRWMFEDLIAYASRGTWVRAGDVLGSGTFGNGCIVELSAMHGEERFPWLRVGDVVSIEM